LGWVGLGLITATLSRGIRAATSIFTTQGTLPDKLVTNNLAEHTDSELAAKPLTERAEILLGLRPYPKEKSD